MRDDHLDLTSRGGRWVAPGHAQQFVGRLRDAFEPDDRFRALFLTGSIGRGTGDEFSDVDTLLVVDATRIDHVLEMWDSVSSALGPFVCVKRLPGFSVFNHVLPQWLRWDVTIASSDAVPPLVAQQVQIVFDKEQRALIDARPAQFDRDASWEVVREFFRCLALLSVVVGRNDPVTGVSGTLLLRQLTIQLMRLIDEPGSGAGAGALHLRGSISAERYAALRSLPDLVADMPSVIERHRALCDLFLPMAVSALGERFQQAFARAALEHVSPILGASDYPRLMLHEK